METKRGTTREVNGDLVLGGNSEHTIKNLRDPQAADEPVTLGYYESHGGGGGDASTWSQHPATQDVDMDGNKITGLGAPAASDDAATKQYVDTAVSSAVPTKIENGTSKVEISVSGGNVVVTVAGQVIATFSLTSQTIIGSAFGGRLYIPADDGHAQIRSGGSTSDLTSASYTWLPSGVASYMHGIYLAKDAYDTLASMTALPELEWWDPVWTPMNNVDSVNNVECQYTRTYRAAGGSLVTLEGTIEVEVDDDEAAANLFTPLPVPATSIGGLLAPAICVDLSSGVQAVCVAGVLDIGSGPVLVIETYPREGATGAPATLTIGFRVSYRAA